MLEIWIEDDVLIKKLTERLEGKCYCKFEGIKQKLEPLKELLIRRWSGPIDHNCVE